MNSLCIIEVLEDQFSMFLKKLECITKHDSTEKIQSYDSKEIIRIFSSKPDLYKGIEHVMQAAYVGAINTSVESIAESIISIYNRHNSDIRPIGEDAAND